MVTALKPHPLQARAYYTDKKYVGLACGRGSGKSEIAKNRVVRALAETTAQPSPIYFYLLPTFAQAKRVAWEDFLTRIPKAWISKTNVADQVITTHFGSSLYVLGGDKPERLEGVQWAGGVVDEACEYRPGVWDKSLVPAMTHHCRFAWRIGVPKRYGSSANEFKEWFFRTSPNKACYAWPSSDIIDPAKLEEIKAELAIDDYNEQFNAHWLNASGGIYKEFSDKYTVTAEATYSPNLPIFVGCDFNVDPMSWVLSHFVNGKIIVFDEVKIRNTTTQRTLDALWNKYAEHKAGWFFTGDAASRQRSTSSDLTDYLIINNDARFKNKGINFPDSNPGLSARFATVNAALRSADKKRHLFINPACTGLIRDLRQQAYEPGTSDVDYSDKTIGHSTDALGYLVMYLRPLRLSMGGSVGIYSTVG
jgi:hypothetical protein